MNQDLSIDKKQQKEERIGRNALVVGSMTFISRIAGFMRDIVIARVFGVSAELDAFLIAFKIPNFMRRLFAEGAFAQAFVPIMAEYRETRSLSDVKKLIANSYTILGLILFFIVLVGIFFSPILIKISAPGLDFASAKLTLAAKLLVITLPYIFFISLVSLYGGALNTYNKFIVPAITPVLLNISLIFSCFFLIRFFTTPIYALAWGVFIGGILQLLLQICALYKQGILIMPSLNSDLIGVKRILKNMVPALFGASVAQLGLLLDTAFGSLLPDGSISWLYYSDRLMQFPLGIFGVGLATVALPYLSRQHAAENKEGFNNTANWAFKWVLLISIPAGIGLFCLSDMLLFVLFYSDKFTINDVVSSSLSLKAFACGLNFFILAKLLTSIFYSRKNIKTPVKIAAICLCANVLVDYLLISSYKHVAIAIGVSFSSFINCSLLLLVLIKQKIIEIKPDLIKFISKILCANFVLVLFLVTSKGNLAAWQYSGRFFTAAHMAEIIVVSIMLYSIMLWTLRVDFVGILTSKKL